MSQAVRTTGSDGASSQTPQPNDLLCFLARTLQFHSGESERDNAFEKLKRLKNALDQQETTLLSWPESPSKNRIRETLAKARKLVAEVVEEFSTQG